LVRAIADRVLRLYIDSLRQYLTFDRVRIAFASDDMGFKTGLLFSKEDMIEFVLEPHRRICELSHEAGRTYLLHACGNLSDIMDYLIDTVRIDGKHSFEDTIEDVRELKSTYGQRIALIGGIDVDFLCRASEAQIRERVRNTLDICHPGGGYCLGSGNSVANYIPVDNYLAMLDEGHAYGH
jgi:uroporphyrinogen decarboxylase